ncbi:uncharacterized protein AMSG_11238 [Thecamonas trahens ATCC 50062]|uniref:F-box/LRR-repeat protein 15-like leucin rich repeat domain-containing protein n=1 Tax=Thecamonas trahens ATCC 50062 TaxID=461836 RepID=A0A0L0DUC5_THETB|nr:hypothetical protein AMSG_11238 [Thecamonas trahens ATCC 50062]KNC55802.1 hypothetical protein AMSG_11238 [Thecamonas trahens ATCC 50062]|eukprot:XP_013752827.1 hypothetical protein AMSG_11238 [Thecamonas trahens ATCC 50062]
MVGNGAGVAELVGQRNNNLTDAMVEVVAEKCPSVVSIDLTACSQITDLAVIAIANSCPNLVSLNLSKCRNITDVAVDAIANSCPHLTDLDLTCCFNITDAAVVALAAAGPHLTDLKLACCPINDAAVIAVAGSCVNLATLSLGRCSITDAAVLALAAGCPNLTDLDLDKCPKTTLDLDSARDTINKPGFLTSDYLPALFYAVAQDNNPSVLAALARICERARWPSLISMLARSSALDNDTLSTLIDGGVGLFDLDDDGNHVYVYSPESSAAAMAGPMIESLRADGDGDAELANGINKATLALFVALRAADTIPFTVPTFAFLINSGADINAVEPVLGLRPLHIAVSLSNILATMALLAAGPTCGLWAPAERDTSAAREIYSLVVGTASVPERVALYVRESIAGGNIGAAGASAGSASRVEELKVELASTRAELDAAKAEISLMQDKLAVAEGEIKAFRDDRAQIIARFEETLSDEALRGLPWTHREAIVKAKLGSDAEWSSTFGQLSRDEVDVLARVAREMLKPQASKLYSRRDRAASLRAVVPCWLGTQWQLGAAM